MLAATMLALHGCAATREETAPRGCEVNYVSRAQPAGFTADVRITSRHDRLRRWTLTYDFPHPGQQVTHGWGANWAQTGSAMRAEGDEELRPGQAVTIGLNGTAAGGIPTPTRFMVNGVECRHSSDDELGTAPTPGPGSAPELAVSGNRIVDADGVPVDLVGVNRSGGEYLCVNGSGPWEGPVDDAAVAAIAAWRATAVRVALNADCWLGVGAASVEHSGARYRQAVAAFVATLEARGIVPILELHWTHGRWTGEKSRCDSPDAKCQKPMPDARYTPAFWSSVADTFRHDRAVVFDLFNEPYPNDIGVMDGEQSWKCWLVGQAACPGLTYPAAGMQELVDAVRRVGARNLVMVSGNGYAGDLTGWLSHRPADPTGNIGAAWHTYDISGCNTVECWERQIAPVAAVVPVLALEIGEMDCAHGYVDRLMPWLDQHDIGYLAWTWNTWDCRSGPALISDYAGIPTPYGVGVREHLLNR